MNDIVKTRERDILYVGEVELEMRLKKKLLFYRINQSAVKL